MSETKKDTSLKWCYIGENKEYVLMTCSKEEWENLCDIVVWAKNRILQDFAHESDEWNYDYTRESR